jgi:AraC-like DNA-binding protein
MVKLIHEDRAGMPPITLDEITEYLNSKTESLNTICRKIFNMDVIELVRRVRLEQTRKAFLTPHSSTGLKEFTKKRTALYYGFKHWKKFEAAYSLYFGETPSQTIDRSSKNLYSFSAWQGE